MPRTRGSNLLFCFLFLLSCSSQGSIYQQDFERILDALQLIYAPDFDRRQLRLRINGDWETERPEASARLDEDRRGRLAVVRVTGGLARHPMIDPGAFALVVCHELGHFLAGRPALGRYSTEGQSDYFGASNCMRRLFERMPGLLLAVSDRVPPTIRRRCEAAWSLPGERAICEQTILAGLALSSYLADRQGGGSPDVTTPDPNIATVMSFGTPTVQCRLDTFTAAALCNPQTPDATDAKRPWLCVRNGPLSNAARPSCWFNRQSASGLALRSPNNR